MTSHEFKKLLDKYSQGECTEEERAFILDWYGRIDRDMREGLNEDRLQDVESRMWSKIRPARPSNLLNHLSTWKIAAAVVLLCLVGPAAFLSYKKITDPGAVSHNPGAVVLSDDLINPIGNSESTPKQVSLKDGSEVILEPGSEIRLAENFGDAKREVYLTGQAFFNVRRDTLKPFLVYSNEVVTKVLGTSFTVRAFKEAEEVTVDVRSGKVSVYRRAQSGGTVEAAQEDEVILSPNQRAVYHRSIHQVSKQLVEVPHIILPEPTLFQMEYDGAPVVRILEVLEDNYGIDIEFDEAVWTDCTLTTSLTEEGLYERIRIICEAIGAEYEVLGTSIIIKGNGCI